MNATVGTTLYDVTDVITQHNVTCSNHEEWDRYRVPQNVFLLSHILSHGQTFNHPNE